MGRRSRYAPALEEGRRPVFVRLAAAVSRDIRAGVLPPGCRLPGTRALAERLGLHRNTVNAAYRELAAEGWIRGRPGSGHFVAPDVPARRWDAVAATPVRSPPEMAPPLNLSQGMPDLRLLPTAEIGRAWRRAMKLYGKRLCAYGDPRGSLRLRAVLAESLREWRGIAVSPDRVVITRGSQMGLYLAAHVLLRKGDRVAVEELGYGPAWEALRSAGAEFVGVGVDGEGMRVDDLPSGIRMVYVTPHHQFPTGVVLSASRRLRLLERAHHEGFVVLEDDYDHELVWSGAPVPPLASLDPGVVYVGTLSKVFAPGLRVGYVVADPERIAAIQALRRIIDRQGDAVLEHALAEIIEEGVLGRHIRKCQRVYRRRREALLEALASQLDGIVHVDPPPGGMCLWARTSVDADAWAEQALRLGVSVAPGSRFSLDRAPRPYLRLGFCPHDEATLREGVARLKRALRAEWRHDGSVRHRGGDAGR